jgi:hypothetical protein
MGGAYTPEGGYLMRAMLLAGTPGRDPGRPWGPKPTPRRATWQRQRTAAPPRPGGSP